MNISRNASCPCGSGIKYKKCCWRNVDWEKILTKSPSDAVLFLSARGKNIAFLNYIGDALQLNNLTQLDNKSFKKSCTPQAVKNIHRYILELWPNENDLARILKQVSQKSSGLYIGHYDPESIERGILRHSLYTERVLLLDPFLDPRIINKQYNPVVHPELHMENTIKDIRIWLRLVPWIESDIVTIVKNPCDFDLKLEIECIQKSKVKYETNDELKSLIKVPPEIEEEFKEWFFLSQPDSYLKKTFKQLNPEAEDKYFEKLLDEIKDRRDEHPYFSTLQDKDIEKFRPALITMKSGANYEMAKIIASATGSHLITDLPYRWKEIEIDRSDYQIKNENWNSFSKAFQNLGIKFLNNVEIKDAIEIRNENYLSGIRNFLSRLWRNCKSENIYDQKNVIILEEELVHHLKEAEIEWSEIKGRALKTSGTISAGLVAAGQAIGNGSAEYLIGSLLINGITNLGKLWLDKNHFEKKYPASFFIKIDDRK